ncbi:unnamed protein product [Brassica oleracea]
MDLVQIFLLSIVSLCSFSYILIKSLFIPKNKKRLPPMAAGAWPIIGHLRAFDNGQPTHVTLADLSDVYGPVFMTKVGSVNTLIINNQEIAEEIYTVHDKVLNQPAVTASKLLCYNDLSLSFSTDISYWGEMRKLAVSEILCPSVIDMHMHIRAREVDVAFIELYRRWEQKGESQKGLLVDIGQELHDLTKNISLMTIVGKKYYGKSLNCEIQEAMRCRKLLQDCTDYMGIFLFSDFIPPLGWLEWRIKRDMKKTGSEIDEVLEAWVDEHKKKRKDSGEGFEKTFLDLLIDIFEQQKTLPLDDAHTTTKAICLNLVMSGSATTIAVLVWAVSLLVNNPHALRKAQEELNRTTGKDRFVEESDLKDLVYLQAVIKETLRLYPPVTLVAYRDVTEAFDIANGKFHVPAGRTQLLVNAWKIHRDPSLWSNTESFEPERFLTVNRKVYISGRNYKLLPFGLGRKACPAIPLGLRMVQYILARLLQSFDVVRPSSQEVDMTENSGLLNLKATPLEVFITPRLRKSLYKMDRVGLD